MVKDIIEATISTDKLGHTSLFKELKQFLKLYSSTNTLVDWNENSLVESEVFGVDSDLRRGFVITANKGSGGGDDTGAFFDFLDAVMALS